MSPLGLSLLIVAISLSNGADDFVTEVLKDLNIIPKYLDRPPNAFIRVVYDKNLVAENDVEITPRKTKDPPTVEWLTSVATFYTLIMVSPDAPGRANPYLREWLHWLVVNIPDDSDVKQGTVLCPYIPSLAPKDAGLLRYAFLIFEQDSYTAFDEPTLNDTSTAGHDHFDTIKFAEKYDLGPPIAATTFQAQFDDFVPIAHAKLHVVERR